MKRDLTRNRRRVALLLLPFWLCLAYAAPVEAQPTVTKSWSLANDVNGNVLVDAGDTIKYTVEISAATNVIFADPVPDPNTTLVVGSVTCSGGSVCTVLSGNAAGDTQVGVQVGDVTTTATITFEVTVLNPLPVGVVQVINQGGASCDSCGSGVPTDDPSTGAANDPTATPINNFAALSAEKTAALQVDADGSGNISPGDTLKYTVVITNTSSDHTAGGVAFADAIPDPNTHLVATSVTTTQGSVTTGNGASDSTVAVDVGTLSPGGSATITFQVVITNPIPAGVNQIVDQGGAGCINCSPQALPTDDPSTATVGDPTITAVVAAPKLTVTKTAALQVDADGSGNISPGDTLRYTVTVTNSGNQDAAAVFADPVPDPNTSLVVPSVTTTQGTILSGNTTGDTVASVDLGSVPGVIGGVNGVATIAFDVKIKNPLPAFVNQVVNQGGVTCSNCTPPGQPSDDPSTGTVGDPTITLVVAAPVVTASKSVELLVDQNNDGQVNPGDILKYTIVVTNNGNQDASGVLVLDPPAPGAGSPYTDLVVGSVTTTLGTIVAGNNPGDPIAGVQIATLGGLGGSATITVQMQVKPTVIGHVYISNYGSVTGGNFSPTQTNTTITAAVGPVPAPAISQLGLLALASLLTGVAALGLRRRTTDRSGR